LFWFANVVSVFRTVEELDSKLGVEVMDGRVSMKGRR
jgi:hypothetical protein